MRKRRNQTCYYCGEPFAPWRNGFSPRVPTREHRLPRSLGGGDGKKNVVLACWACNNEKGNMKEYEFKVYLSATAGIPDREGRRAAWEKWKVREGMFLDSKAH